MAISNFGQLREAMESYMDRTDLNDRLPTFFALTQAKIFNGFRSERGINIEPVRLRSMQKSADLVLVDRRAALPARYLEGVRLYVDAAERYALSYLSPEDFWSRGGATVAGPPVFYTIEGEEFVFAPGGNGATVKLLYYERPEPLSDDADTDWLLSNYPNIYLAGVLSEAYAYIEESVMAQHWEDQLQGSVDGLQVSTDRGDASGSPLIMRPRAVF